MLTYEIFTPAKTANGSILVVRLGRGVPRRQGLDVGSQYRSAIFFHSPEQEAAASASRDREQVKRRGRIVTEIVPASAFYRAEEYHQRYFEKSGRAACAVTLR